MEKLTRRTAPNHVVVSLTDDLKRRVDRICNKLDRSRNYIVNVAVQRHIDEFEKEAEEALSEVRVA